MRTEAENLIEQARDLIDQEKRVIAECRSNLPEAIDEKRSIERAPVDVDKIRQRAAFMVEQAAVRYAADRRFAEFAQAGPLNEAACWRSMNDAAGFGMLAKLFPEAVTEMIVTMAGESGRAYSSHRPVNDDDRRAALREVGQKIASYERKEELAIRKLHRAGVAVARRPDAPDLSHIVFGALEAECSRKSRERE